jgi:hypothetical protein
MAIARNAVHDFVTASPASIPTTTSTMKPITAYRAGDCFMGVIVDVPLGDVKGAKHLGVATLFSQNVITF